MFFAEFGHDLKKVILWILDPYNYSRNYLLVKDNCNKLLGGNKCLSFFVVFFSFYVRNHLLIYFCKLCFTFNQFFF